MKALQDKIKVVISERDALEKLNTQERALHQDLEDKLNNEIKIIEKELYRALAEGKENKRKCAELEESRNSILEETQENTRKQDDAIASLKAEMNDIYQSIQEKDKSIGSLRGKLQENSDIMEKQGNINKELSAKLESVENDKAKIEKEYSLVAYAILI